MKKRAISNPIFLLVAIFISLRLVILLCSGHIYKEDVEELDFGNFAVTVSSGGPMLPFRMYKHTPYHGAGLLTSLLALPVFLCFGSSYLGLKLVPLIWSTATFVFLYMVVARYADRKAAVITCLLYLIPHANAMYYSLLADATHHFTFTCTLAMLLCFHSYNTVTRETNVRLWAAILGFMMGFSYFLWASNLIAALILLGYFLWKTERILDYKAVAAMLFLCVGLLLGILIPHWAGLHEFIFTQYSYKGCQALFETVRRAYRLFGPALLASYRPWGTQMALWEWIAYTTGLASYVWFLWAALKKQTFTRGALAAVIIAYPLVFTPLFAASGLTYIPGPQRPFYDHYHVRYAYPLANIFMLSEALMIATLLSRHNRLQRAAGAALLIVLMTLGVYSTYGILVPPAPGVGLRQPGCFMQEIGCRISENYLDNWPEFDSFMVQVNNTPDVLVRNDIARGAAWIICLNRITCNNLSNDDPSKFSLYEYIVAHHVPPRLQGLFREEIGAFVFWHSGFDLSSTLDKLMKGLSSENADASFSGVARMLPAWTTDPPRLEEALRAIPLRDKSRLAYAMGQYFSAMPDREAIVRTIAGNLAEKEAFLAGSQDPFGTRMYWPPIQCH